MSSLWTPGGEHPVDREGGRTTEAPAGAAAPPDVPFDEADLTPEERAAAEEYARQIDAAREQMLQVPAGVVVGQQALQFVDLAVLHLSQPEPRLDEARVAIDALAAVVNGLGARLGEAEAPLRQTLNQIQLAFVDATRAVDAPGAAGDEAAEPTSSVPADPPAEAAPDGPGGG
jgi:hypothetical protein